MNTQSLDQEFAQIKGQLKSYILRITASVPDTEDIVQDTYLKARDKMDTFEGKSSLKTWIFAIASNLAKDLLKSKKRWPENVTDICREEALNEPSMFAKSMFIRNNSPQGNFEIKEHIAFCFTCISKSLPLEQHLCILLKEVYDFSLKEVATILQVTEQMVKYYLHTGRSKMIEIFDGRCALINQNGICHQCTEINGIFNPKQNAQEELMKIKMVKEAKKGEKQHLFDLRMEVVAGIDPFESGAAELQLHHLEFNRKTMEKYLKKND